MVRFSRPTVGPPCAPPSLPAWPLALPSALTGERPSLALQGGRPCLRFILSPSPPVGGPAGPPHTAFWPQGLLSAACGQAGPPSSPTPVVVSQARRLRLGGGHRTGVSWDGGAAGPGPGVRTCPPHGPESPQAEAAEPVPGAPSPAGWPRGTALQYLPSLCHLAFVLFSPRFLGKVLLKVSGPAPRSEGKGGGCGQARGCGRKRLKQLCAWPLALGVSVNSGGARGGSLSQTLPGGRGDCLGPCELAGSGQQARGGGGGSRGQESVLLISSQASHCTGSRGAREWSPHLPLGPSGTLPSLPASRWLPHCPHRPGSSQEDSPAPGLTLTNVVNN